MRVLSIANHKGGVGKSATAHALGVALAATGLRVLLIDTDPQASLTQACGLGLELDRSLADVMGGSQPGRYQLREILHQIDDGLYIAPADIALSAVELGLASRMGREYVFRRALLPVMDSFDLVLIDCPPSLGLLTVGALAASNAVLVPSQPQVVDLRGLSLFIDTLDTIRDEINPALELMGILITFYDSRLTHHQAAVEAIRNAGLPVLPVAIGRSVRVAEAAGSGQSVVTYEPSNKRAEEYLQLSEVLKQWLKTSEQQD